MKKIVLFISTVLLMISCNKNEVFYSGNKYDIIRIDDSTFLVIPNKNEDAKVTTIQIDRSRNNSKTNIEEMEENIWKDTLNLNTEIRLNSL